MRDGNFQPNSFLGALSRCASSGRVSPPLPRKRCAGAAAYCAAVVAWCAAAPAVYADFRDDIGLTQLRASNPSLNGSGVDVGQPEAPQTSNGNDFELNPVNGNVGYTAAQMIYVSSLGTVTGGTPPNSAGTESGHADAVASVFFGSTYGVAPSVSHVYNYDANYFYNSVVHSVATATSGTPARVVSQSFTFGSQNSTVDQDYDNYTAKFGTIFVSAVGGAGINGNRPTSPGTPYNTISVNSYTVPASAAPVLGPATVDLRSKPDISAPASPPGSETSYVTPEVAGAAAILVQAAGTNTLASDHRTVKALLLNGAVKPAGWTRTAGAPLDPSYGAGELNVFNAYTQFNAGRQSFTASNTTQGPAGLSGTAVASRSGWDNNSITSTASNQVNHYLFNLTGASAFNLTTTLVWDRDLNQTNINNLSLYLYNTATPGTPVDMSTSNIDNVQDLYDLNLPPGSYDLEVVKAGGVINPLANGVVSAGETYALAFNFAAVPEPSSLLVLAGVGAVALIRRPCHPRHPRQQRTT